MPFEFDVEETIANMVGAAAAVFGQKWPQIQAFGKEEMAKIAQRTRLIGELVIAGELSGDEGKLLLRMQVNAAAGTLAVFEGISLLMAEQAINAALGILQEVVKGLLPFNLFPWLDEAGDA